MSFCFFTTQTLGCILARSDLITLYENNANLLDHDVEGSPIAISACEGISIELDVESESEKESEK